MNLILEEMQKAINENEEAKNEEANSDEDETTFVYYGESCTCSRNSMCKSRKCLCFIKGVKCNEKCHGTYESKCSNK